MAMGGDASSAAAPPPGCSRDSVLRLYSAPSGPRSRYIIYPPRPLVQVDLGLFYANTGLGEKWTVYSWIQAAGFVVLVSGTLVYRCVQR